MPKWSGTRTQPYTNYRQLSKAGSRRGGPLPLTTPAGYGGGSCGTWFLEDQVGKDLAMTNTHRGSLNLSVLCSSQARVFIQVEQVLQFLKDVFSKAVTKDKLL